jgi:hypothetical protein
VCLAVFQAPLEGLVVGISLVVLIVYVDYLKFGLFFGNFEDLYVRVGWRVCRKADGRAKSAGDVSDCPRP